MPALGTQSHTTLTTHYSLLTTQGSPAKSPKPQPQSGKDLSNPPMSMPNYLNHNQVPRSSCNLDLLLSLVLKAALESEEHTMTSTHTRRSFGGTPLKTKKTHSRSSSSTTSVQIETPFETTPSTSPSQEMPPRTNGAQSANALTEDMANAEINGARRTRKGMPLDRKQSTPMMPAFMVSAPGKVIVFGEHAVVHGKVHQDVCCLLSAGSD